MNVEDIVTVVRFVLDYVGFDVDDWNVEFDWRRWRGDVRHRNLVRLVGTYVTNSKVRRINFQPQMIGQVHSDNNDSVFYMSSDSLLVGADNDDRVWVEHELADGCIEIRACNRNELTLGNCTEVETGGLLRHLPGKTSTPLSMCQMDQSAALHDTHATDKISAMEDELAKLREQIATIVLSQEQGSVLHTPCETTMDANKSLQPDLVRCVSTVPPPPPPPPLPPLHIVNNSTSSLHKKTTGHTSDVETHKTAVSMCDVLRDIGNVKLRAVMRSPGGTPLRRAPRQCDTSDPASLIASALKKKFAHRRMVLGSPSTDKENSSPEPSPSTPLGPHMLKKSGRSKSFERRRSALCVDSDSAPSPLSPLTENNAV